MNNHNKLSLWVIISSVLMYLMVVFITMGSTLFLPILALFRYELSFNKRMSLVVLWASLGLRSLKFLCGLDYKIHGEDNLHKLSKQEKGFVVASNHQSAWDILGCITIFKRATFLAKASLLRIPFFGSGFALLKPITIDRKKKTSAMRSLLEQGTARLQENYIFVTFPEGRRQPMNTIGEYSVGGLLLASKTGAMVLPMVHNAGSYWARKSPWRFPGTIQVVIGEAIDSTQYDPRELTQKIEQWSRQQLQLIQQGTPDPYLKIDSLQNEKELL